MSIGKGISIAIDESILSRIDEVQPSHLTRKAFVNQLLFEAVEKREASKRQVAVAASK